MKVQKKVSVQGEFAKVGEDIKDGDKVTILDAGTQISGQYGDQIAYRIKTRNGDKNLSFNTTSTNNLIDAYGDETEAWIGKEVNVTILKAMVSGTLRNVVYLYAPGWAMDNSGKFRKVSEGTTEEKSIQVGEDDINPDDIPF